MKNIIYVVNGILMFLICWLEYNSDSDKTIAIAALAFSVLVFANLLLAVLNQIHEKPVCRYYYISAAGLVAVVVIAGFLFLLNL